MKAIVTGGSGFLGHYIVKELVKQGIETLVVDKFKGNELLADTLNESGNLVKFIKGDVRDVSLMKNLMEECDIVFHTAAIANIDEARTLPFETMDVNVMGTVNCLNAAAESDVKRFLFASSVYTAGDKGSFYRVSKKTGEMLCKTFFEEYGLEYTILRYGSLYGRESNQWNFIYTICKSLLQNGEFTYISSPDSQREYIHIVDASQQTIRIALDEDFVNKTVLITGHQRIKVKELFLMIEEILGKKLKVNYIQEKEHRHYIMTPYSYEVDAPIRINLPTYIDISEGILDCLKYVQNELDAPHDYEV